MKGEWLRSPRDTQAILFIHGILSSAEGCWTSSTGVFWPSLIVDETPFEGMGVYLYSYSTGIFSGTYSLSDVVDNLKEHMRLDGLFKMKTIIFVCHSMGGIIVRKLLVERTADFVQTKMTCGLFMVASPSLGSDYARWLTPMAKFLGHKQALALRFARNNDWLNDLDKEFQNLKEGNHFPILGKELIEDKFLIMKRVWGLQVVKTISGARYFGERLKIPESDHSSIAKPSSKDALQHRALVAFIHSLIGQQSHSNVKVRFRRPAILTLDTVKSTNDESWRRISEGQTLPFIVHAWSQTHGRGKANRVWQGGAGVLTATWNYSFEKTYSGPAVLGMLSVLSGLSVRDAIRTLNPSLSDLVHVKWPNDVLIGGKKAAGILVEVSEVETDRICAIGIGINISRTPVLTDQRLYALPPASVFDDFQNEVDREVRTQKAITLVTEALENRLSRLFVDGELGSQAQEWTAADFYLNRQIRIQTPQSNLALSGIDKGINNLGQLVVEFQRGQQKAYFSAEISSVSGALTDLPPEQIGISESVRTITTSQGDEVEEILAPIPCGIYDIPPYIRVGNLITAGTVLCIGEAMKMAFSICSPNEGKIISIHCIPGDLVSKDQLLFRIERTSKPLTASTDGDTPPRSQRGSNRRSSELKKGKRRSQDKSP